MEDFLERDVPFPGFGDWEITDSGSPHKHWIISTFWLQ